MEGEGRVEDAEQIVAASLPAYTSRGDRHLGYSSRHTQVPVLATTHKHEKGSPLNSVLTSLALTVIYA